MRAIIALTFAALATACSAILAPVGGGSVTFGSALDRSTLEISGPARTTFSPTDDFAFSAVLSEPAGATELTMVVAKVEGSETVMFRQPVQVADPSFVMLGNSFGMEEMAPFLDGPGTYALRFFRDATKLAEGTFELTE